MADISKYLQDILSAVYGEEVRGSIHDAIEIINDVSEVVLTTGTAISGPTSSSEGFFVDSLYLNISTMELWKCVGTNSWQSLGVLKGSDGSGIASIDKTGTSGLVDTYTITFDDGHTETFDITNGADGADGKNGSIWYKGTALSGTGTSITGFPGNKNDFYLNSTDGYVYTCVKAGGAMLPDAAEWDYVMTLTGGGGSSVTVIDSLISTSSTDALSANQGRVLDGKKQNKYASYSAGLKETNPTPDTIQLTLDLLAGSNISLQNENGAVKISAQTGQGGSSTFAGLDDTDINNPQADQIVQYKSVGGQMKLQNVNMPQGGHTMIPVSGDMDAIAALNNGNDNYVVNAYSAKRWSNCEAKEVMTTASQDADGVGTWEDDATWESGSRSGWLWSSELYRVLEDENGNTVLDIDISPIFDIGKSETVGLLSYRIDDNYPNGGVNGGCVAFKFTGAIKNANGVKVGLKLVHQRTEVYDGTILT